jgi:hypothetical protein
MAHDAALQWAEVECGPQVFEVKVEGQDLLVRGDCPRCRGQTTWRFRKGQMGAVESETDPSLSTGGRATIVCACGSFHADRPPDANESGCGAFWAVDLDPSPR